MYFTSEEEYVAHWNSFHAAISPWFICPVSECLYVAAGEPDALDWYLDHVAQQHVTSSEGGQLERERAQRPQTAPSAGVSITNTGTPNKETTSSPVAAPWSIPQRRVNLASAYDGRCAN